MTHSDSLVYHKRSDESEGYIYIAGSSRNDGDATVGSYQTDFNGGEFDGFIAKIDLDLSNYSFYTYLGGSNRDVIMDMDVYAGFAYVTGSTYSKDFPTTDIAYQNIHSEPDDNICTGTDDTNCAEVFVTRLSRDAGSLNYSTFYGNGNEEYARGIAVSGTGQAYVTGASTDRINISNDIFVIKLEGGGENLLYENVEISGLSLSDHGEEIVVDSEDRAHIVGTISEDGYATGVDSFTYHGGVSDIFYARLNDEGDIDYFSYLGGSAEDRGFAIATRGGAISHACGSGDVFCSYIVGSTVSDDVTMVEPLEGHATRAGGVDILLCTLCDVDIDPKIITANFEKTAPNEKREGEEIRYRLITENTSDVEVPVSIRDEVPDQIEITSTDGGCNRHADSNIVTCSFDIAGDSTEARAIVGTVKRDIDCPLLVENIATLDVCGFKDIAHAPTLLLCKLPDCGNGETEPPDEECDGQDGCRENCTWIRCGDGIRDPGEECDGGQCCTDKCKRVILEKGAECENTECPCASGTVCRRDYWKYEECWPWDWGPFCDTEWWQTVKRCLPPVQ